MGVALMTNTGTKLPDEIKVIDEQRILNWLQTAYKQRQIVDILFETFRSYNIHLQNEYGRNEDSIYRKSNVNRRDRNSIYNKSDGLILSIYLHLAMSLESLIKAIGIAERKTMTSAVQSGLNPTKIVGKNHNFINMLERACKLLFDNLNETEKLLLERLTDAVEIARYPSPTTPHRLQRIKDYGQLGLYPDCILLNKMFDSFDFYLKDKHSQKLIVEQAEIIFDNLSGSIFDETCAETYAKFKEATKSGGIYHGILTDEELTIVDNEIEKRL
ncbi:MAG TPA: hypothetical protein VKA08_05435 [Balneolales bacterium]|nr:hypothetical protein [Balneolales bacterium]